MPELPDVEQYRRFFHEHAVGKTVAWVEADPTIVRNATPRRLGSALRRRRFTEPERHGKWLICWTDGPALLLHFGMTGDLTWSESEPARHRHDRLIVGLVEGGELRYRNMRKLGGAWLAHDRQEVDSVLGTLGPDALGIGRRGFLKRLERRRGGIKAALMDQRLVAGIGNLMADEILWQARIHPRRRIESMADDERDRLYTAIHAVLREAVRSYDYLSRKRAWLSRVRGVPGGACPRCAAPLARTVAGGRTTYFCASCQPSAGVPGTRRR
jgi:formamidopyrimidine-DNA glycosylase